MKRQYNVGLDTNQIIAEVDAGTRGIAYSAMYQVRSGGQSTLIADSNTTGSGDIKPVNIGQALTLGRSYIVIRSIIDFSQTGLTNDERAVDISNLVIKYIISGGFSATQIYNFDTDDIVVKPDNSIAVITKAIEMV